MRKSKLLSSSKSQKCSLNFDEGIAKEILNKELGSFTADSYMPYAISVILGRGISSARDGLSPVQRRILWSMWEDKITSSAPFVKLSTIAGSAMRFHPHGDLSIVSSAVRLGQSFSLRTTLIEPKGSFAKVYGDKSAAPRYISGRLTKAAMECLVELKNGGGVMGMNYDNEYKEAQEMPVRWPVSIINNTQGIAVGYATQSVQHNPTEAMNVARAMLKNPNMTVKDIMKIMPGPDFSTGGYVFSLDKNGNNAIEQYYTTGSSTITIRAKCDVEHEGSKTILVFTELPPMVCLSSASGTGVQDKILEILDSESWGTSKDKDKRKKYTYYATARKALQGVRRVYDQTDFDTDGAKFEVELKAGSNVDAVIAALYNYTDLETKFSVNNTFIVDGRPKQVGIKELFTIFLDYRRECVTKTSKFKKNVNLKRLGQLEGLLKIILDIDKAISLIRSSKDDKIAKAKLMKEFKISDEQAEYILSMALRRLTRQDKNNLMLEKKTLEDDNKKLDAILSSKKALDAEVDRLLIETSAIIASDRKMTIVNKSAEETRSSADDIQKTLEQAEKNEPCRITVKANGTVVRTSKVDGAITANHINSIMTSTKSNVITVYDDGSAYLTPASYFAEGVSLNCSDVVKTKAKMINIADGSKHLLTVTSNGFIKFTDKPFDVRWNGKTYHKLKDSSDRIIAAEVMPDDKELKDGNTVNLLIITKFGKVIRFDPSSINSTGIGAAGVRGIKLANNDRAVKALLSLNPDKDVITTVSHMTVKSTKVNDIPLQNRDGSGVILHTLMGNDSITDAIVNGGVVDGRRVEVIPATKRAARLNQPLKDPKKTLLAVVE